MPPYIGEATVQGLVDIINRGWHKLATGYLADRQIEPAVVLLGNLLNVDERSFDEEKRILVDCCHSITAIAYEAN